MPALLTAQRSIGGSGGPLVKVERAPVHARQCRSTTSRKGQLGAAFACPPLKQSSASWCVFLAHLHGAGFRNMSGTQAAARDLARARRAMVEVRGRKLEPSQHAVVERSERRMMACGRSEGTEWGGKWWAVRGSNPRPSRCKRDALPAELTALACPVTGPRHETTCLRSRAANLQAGCGPFALFRRHTQTPGRRTSGCLVFSNTMPDLLAKRVLHGMPSR